MSDEAKPNDNVVQTQQTVEVLSPKGETMSRGDSSIASIFDKIESAKNSGEDVKEVLKAASTPQEPTKAPKIEAKPVPEPTKQKSEPSDLDKKLTETQDKKIEDEEISRGKLFEQTEPKKEVEKPKVEDKKVIPDAQPASPEDDVPDDELKVLPHDKPKTAKRIQALLKKIDAINSDAAKTKTEATEKANKLLELEKKLSEVKTVDPKTDEAIKKQLEELSMYRRRYDLEKDPEISGKFTGRIDSSEASIIATLKNHKAGDALLNLVKEEGGWVKFSASTKPVTLADNTVVSSAELSDMILKSLPLGDRKAVESAMMDQISTKRERDALFEKEQKTANEYFAKQEQENQARAKAQQDQIQEAANKIEAWHKGLVEKNEWLKEKEIPVNATPEQKAAIADDNKYTRQLNHLITKSLSTKSLDESLDMVFDSIRFYQERREKAKLQSEVTALKAELAKRDGEINKIRSSSRTLPKTGTVSAGGSAQPTKKESSPVGLEAAFAAIESGELGGKNTDE